jgi:uncharacterized NAD(P)/FAD-binding protein YdhS
MNSESIFDVAVIGAGASGSLVARQFSKVARSGARLALIGAGSRPARGVAYETPYLANLLNVPAGNMSAFPDDPEHFARWLAQRLPGADAANFAPRSIYGEYLAAILDETLQGETVSLIDNTATGLSFHNGVWCVQLQSGAVIAARCVVLAIGNVLTPAPVLDTSRIAPLYRGNPWGADAIQGLSHTAPVLLIGTGLTTVDVALSLRESGHEGQITAVSRHGRFYRNHAAFTPHPLAGLPYEFRTPRGAVRWTRDAIRHIHNSGGNWRAVIDSLRPYTAQVWRSWSLPQRASFLRHARNIWDTHRHRMAPEVAAHLKKLLADGILTVHAGRLIAAETAGGSARITIRSTLTGDVFTVDAERVINCTGPARNYGSTDIPLIASMRTKGWLTPDLLRLGIETDRDGRLVSSDGTVNKTLFTIGPLRIPELFESIAIPEIRVQACELAQLLATD